MDVTAFFMCMLAFFYRVSPRRSNGGFRLVAGTDVKNRFPLARFLRAPDGGRHGTLGRRPNRGVSLKVGELYGSQSLWRAPLKPLCGSFPPLAALTPATSITASHVRLSR